MAGGCGCSGQCTCALQTTGTILVAGAGSVANPYTMAARLSTDSGNMLSIGTDGALLAKLKLYRPDGTTLLTVAGDGSVVLPAPCILDYNGDPITPDGDGCIQLPTAGTPPAFGCGLATEEDGTLIVATSAEFPGSSIDEEAIGGSSTDGAGIYCDENGELRGPADHTTVTAGGAGEVIADGLTVVSGTTTSPGMGSVTLHNPSPARRMIVSRFVVATVDIITPPLGGARVRLQENVNGAGWTDVRSLRWPELQAVPAGDDTAGAGSIRFEGELSSTREAFINAANDCTVDLRVQVQKVGAGDNDPVVVSASCSLRMFGHTV